MVWLKKIRSWKSKGLSALAFILSLLLTLGLAQSLRAQATYPEIRGVWITNNDTVHFLDQGRTQESVDLLANLNFNTLYTVVWNSGYVLYDSPIARREGLQPFDPKGKQGQDVLADLIARAHRRGLLVLPWFEFGFMAPSSSELIKNHPQWVTQRRDGSKTWVGAAGEVVWLNPFHPEVQNFLERLVLEVVSKYDVDGVQFDDHTALPNEFGYDAYTLALYEKEMKKPAPANPQDAEWTRWRADKLTAFMAQLNRKVKSRKPNILFSLSPATYRLCYQTYLQDWLDWARKGILDEVVVQVYRTNLESFLEPIQRPEFIEAKQRAPTAVGILTGLKTKPVPMPLITEKVRAASSNGLGIAFFYYKTLWDIAPEERSQRLAQFKTLWPVPAPRSLAQKFIPLLPPEPLDAKPTANPQAKPKVAPKSTPPIPAPKPQPSDGFPPEPTLDPALDSFYQ